MPVYALRCPDCGHEFRTLILAGTNPPAIWYCSQCGGDRAAPRDDVPLAEHPWERQQEGRHSYGCFCCGG
jgi:hypothetical protein